MMSWREIVPRISGFSTPIVGISWVPPEPERQVAQRVLADLENRRVLFALTEYEYPRPCMASVEQLRSILTTEKGKVDSHSDLAKQLGAIRSACREFIEVCEQRGLIVDRIADYPYPAKHWEFIDALKRLRDQTGFRVAAIAISFGIYLDDQLASTLPPAQRDND